MYKIVFVWFELNGSMYFPTWNKENLLVMLLEHLNIWWKLLTLWCFQDVDITAKTLLAKNGESNGFIREDVDKVLTAMVTNVTPQRSLLALIAGGAT